MSLRTFQPAFLSIWGETERCYPSRLVLRHDRSGGRGKGLILDIGYWSARSYRVCYFVHAFYLSIRRRWSKVGISHAPWNRFPRFLVAASLPLESRSSCIYLHRPCHVITWSNVKRPRESSCQLSRHVLEITVQNVNAVCLSSIYLHSFGYLHSRRNPSCSTTHSKLLVRE